MHGAQREHHDISITPAATAIAAVGEKAHLRMK